MFSSSKYLLVTKSQRRFKLIKVTKTIRTAYILKNINFYLIKLELLKGVTYAIYFYIIGGAAECDDSLR